jgi:hypothetical protein
MNAIYGSNIKDQFLKLQKLNGGGSKKNNFSMVLIQKNTFDLFKVHCLAKDFKFPPRKKYNMLLGITEQKTKNFNPDRMNPAIIDEWVLSFCGNINNIGEIENEFCDDDTVKSDCEILCQMLKKMSLEEDNDVATISNALTLVEGDYSMWIYNAYTNNGFLAKCNQELYADIYDNSFSSTSFYGAETLNDGELYQLTKEGTTSVAQFDCSTF